MLLECLGKEVVHLDQVRLIVADEANILQTTNFHKKMIEIGDILGSHYKGKRAIHLHTASYFSERQLNGISDRFRYPQPDKLHRRCDSDPMNGIVLSFTTLPDDCADVLFPQQSRKSIL